MSSRMGYVIMYSSNNTTVFDRGFVGSLKSTLCLGRGPLGVFYVSCTGERGLGCHFFSRVNDDNIICCY